MKEERIVVEAAGVEPASVNPLSRDLHAYPAVILLKNYSAGTEVQQRALVLSFAASAKTTVATSLYIWPLHQVV